MRRILLLAAVAASVALPSTGAHALRYCYNNGGGCVYTSGGYVCWAERGSNGTVNEYCVAITGIRQCVTTHSGTQCYNVIPPLR